MSDFSGVERISAVNEPLHWTEEKNQLLYQACREIARFHYQNNKVIRQIFDRYAFKPEMILTESDLGRIPFINVTAMKYHLLLSLAEDRLVLKLTSSGTRGQKTQIWLDQGSLDRVQRMMDVYLEQEGVVSSEPNNYMVFNYDPDDAGDLGIAYSEKNQMRFAPINEHYFAIKKNGDGNWFFDKSKAYAILEHYATQGLPLRIFAMPAFLFEFVEWMLTSGQKPLRFSPSSWIMTGGGWKAAEDKKITRELFRLRCQDAFGIPLSRQRDGYGMAEHCAPYYECSQHRMHVPVYNRVIIRDPVSNRVLPSGEVGVMELLTPFNAMMPTLAILTTDYGRVSASPCPCGWRSPTFEILGRAGLSKHKGCAITASEIVRRS
jgi:phenylacetate-coenzyme A ligase PaaK-like adenylate-forming protein